MIEVNDRGRMIPESGILDHDVSFNLLTLKHHKENFNRIACFECGNKDLNAFIKEAHRHDDCITYLYYLKDELIAFCSMCCTSLQIEKPGVVVHPSIEFRCFAIAKEYRGRCFEGANVKVSSYIFEKCLMYALEVAHYILAAEYFILFAKNESRVRSFYKKHGFVEFTDNMRAGDTRFDECIPAFMKIPSRYSFQIERASSI